MGVQCVHPQTLNTFKPDSPAHTRTLRQFLLGLTYDTAAGKLQGEHRGIASSGFFGGIFVILTAADFEDGPWKVSLQVEEPNAL